MSFFAKISAQKSQRFKYIKYSIGILLTGLTINYSLNKVEFTNRHRIMLVPIRFDRELGQLAEKQVLSQFGKYILPRDSNKTKYEFVEKSVNKIVSNNPLLADKIWKVIIIDNPTSNAFVTANGLICVFSGLLNSVNKAGNKRQDILTAVIAHEIGHVVARHVAEKFGSTIISGFISLAFSIILQHSVFSDTGLYLSNMHYSRKLELEADTIGLHLMGRSCVPLDAAIAMQELIHSTHNKPSWFQILFSTHPSGPERIDKINKQIPMIFSQYSKYCSKRTNIYSIDKLNF